MKKTDSLENRLGSLNIEVPREMHDMVTSTLDNLSEGGKAKVKRRTFRTFAVVTALMLMSVSIAFAVSTFGLLDFFEEKNQLSPKPDAAVAVGTNLAALETELLHIEVSEAAYDGSCLRTLVKLSPLDPQTYGLNVFDHSRASDTPQTESGKEKTLNVGMQMSGSDSMPVDLTRVSLCTRHDGDSLLVYLEDAFISDNSSFSEAPDEFSAMLTVEVISEKDKKADMHEICFNISKSAAESAKFIPTQSSISGMTVNSVDIALTPFAEYLSVRYTVKAPDAMIEFSDGTTYYGTEYGTWLHIKPDCSGMKNAYEYSAQEAAASMRGLCPKCVSGSEEVYGELSESFSWKFDRQENPSVGEYTKQISERSADCEYLTTLICPSGEKLPAAFTLTIEKNGTVVEIPCAISE